MYDASLDIGIAVEEDTKTSVFIEKKKGHKRKRSSSVVSEDNKEDGPNDNDTYRDAEYSKKKKKKKKKKRKTSMTSDGEAGENPNSASVCEQKEDNRIVMPLVKGNYTKERSNLPVYQHRNELCTLVANNDVLLVVAETVSIYV